MYFSKNSKATCQIYNPKTNMKSTNTVLQHSNVTRNRRNKQNGHKSVILWFTGLPCSGKSTLANSVEEKLHLKGYRTFVLDGDNIRNGHSGDLGFSKADREENIRRVGEAAKLMIEAGIIALAAFISPFQSDREAVRNLVQDGDLLEIYCNANLQICEGRDVKGQYKRARAGDIKDFTGIDSPYEAPVNPDLMVETGIETLEVSTLSVIEMLYNKGIIEYDL